MTEWWEPITGWVYGAGQTVTQAGQQVIQSAIQAVQPQQQPQPAPQPQPQPQANQAAPQPGGSYYQDVSNTIQRTPILSNFYQLGASVSPQTVNQINQTVKTTPVLESVYRGGGAFELKNDYERAVNQFQTSPETIKYQSDFAKYNTDVEAFNKNNTDVNTYNSLLARQETLKGQQARLEAFGTDIQSRRERYQRAANDLLGGVNPEQNMTLGWGNSVIKIGEGYNKRVTEPTRSFLSPLGGVGGFVTGLVSLPGSFIENVGQSTIGGETILRGNVREFPGLATAGLAMQGKSIYEYATTNPAEFAGTVVGMVALDRALRYSGKTRTRSVTTPGDVTLNSPWKGNKETVIVQKPKTQPFTPTVNKPTILQPLREPMATPKVKTVRSPVAIETAIDRLTLARENVINGKAGLEKNWGNEIRVKNEMFRQKTPGSRPMMMKSELGRNRGNSLYADMGYEQKQLRIGRRTLVVKDNVLNLRPAEKPTPANVLTREEYLATQPYDMAALEITGDRVPTGMAFGDYSISTSKPTYRAPQKGGGVMLEDYQYNMPGKQITYTPIKPTPSSGLKVVYAKPSAPRSSPSFPAPTKPTITSPPQPGLKVTVLTPKAAPSYWVNYNPSSKTTQTTSQPGAKVKVLTRQPVPIPTAINRLKTKMGELELTTKTDQWLILETVKPTTITTLTTLGLMQKQKTILTTILPYGIPSPTPPPPVEKTQPITPYVPPYVPPPGGGGGGGGTTPPPIVPIIPPIIPVLPIPFPFGGGGGGDNYRRSRRFNAWKKRNLVAAQLPGWFFKSDPSGNKGNNLKGLSKAFKMGGAPFK